MRRIAGQSTQRPSVRQLEIPSAVFLPRLTFLSTKTGDLSITESSRQPKPYLPRAPRSTFQSFSRKSKPSPVSTPPTREVSEIGLPDISVIQRFAPSFTIPAAKDDFSKRETPPILRNHDSFQGSPPSKIFDTPPSSKSSSPASSLRPSRLRNVSIRTLPWPKSPQTR